MFDWWFQLQELVISLQIVIDRTNCRAEFHNDILRTCLIKAPEPGEFITFSNNAVYVLKGIANSTRRRMCEVLVQVLVLNDIRPQSLAQLSDRHDGLLQRCRSISETRPCYNGCCKWKIVLRTIIQSNYKPYLNVKWCLPQLFKDSESAFTWFFSLTPLLTVIFIVTSEWLRASSAVDCLSGNNSYEYYNQVLIQVVDCKKLFWPNRNGKLQKHVYVQINCLKLCCFVFNSVEKIQ